MKQWLLLVIPLVMAMCSCKQKIEFRGRVFSKHGVPMPGAEVLFNYAAGGKEQIVGSYATRTDAMGYFVLSRRIPHNQFIETVAVISADSGRYGAAIRRTKWSNDTIKLQ